MICFAGSPMTQRAALALFVPSSHRSECCQLAETRVPQWAAFTGSRAERRHAMPALLGLSTGRSGWGGRFICLPCPCLDPWRRQTGERGNSIASLRARGERVIGVGIVGCVSRARVGHAKRISIFCLISSSRCPRYSPGWM